MEAEAARKGKDAESYNQASAALSWIVGNNGCLIKAIEARVAGKLDEAIEWEGVVREREKQVEFKLKSIEARRAGKMMEASIWDQAGDAERSASLYLTEGIEAENANNRDESNKKKKKIVLCREAVEDFVKAAEKYATGENGNDWKKSAEKKFQKAKDL